MLVDANLSKPTGQGSIIRIIRGPLANIRESIRGIRRIFVLFANQIVSEFSQWKGRGRAPKWV
jgi:hypothetical protein